MIRTSILLSIIHSKRKRKKRIDNLNVFIFSFYKFHKKISFFSSNDRASCVSIYSKVRVLRYDDCYCIGIYNPFQPIRRKNRYLWSNSRMFIPYFAYSLIFRNFRRFLFQLRPFVCIHFRPKIYWNRLPNFLFFLTRLLNPQPK